MNNSSCKRNKGSCKGNFVSIFYHGKNMSFFLVVFIDDKSNDDNKKSKYGPSGKKKSFSIRHIRECWTEYIFHKES
jgi:hypothetical protein